MYLKELNAAKIGLYKAKSNLMFGTKFVYKVNTAFRFDAVIILLYKASLRSDLPDI